MSQNRIHRTLLCAVIAVLTLALSPAAMGQLALSHEDINMKFGFQGQFWGDWTQDATAGQQGYQQNIYLRRIRLLAGGEIGEDITFFFETDQPNLGKTPKALNAGFLVQDAFLEYKIANAFRLDGGLMLVPFSRNTLQSTLSYYTLDISPIATVNNTSTQSSGLRDLGFQARGFFAKDKLQYRLGMFQGERDTNARNSLRTAGYLQYDFLDKEMGYTYVGTALGKQKILAVNGGFDKQGTYRGLSADIAAAIPVRGGDEIGGQVQFIHYDGRAKFAAIPDQNDLLAEAAYYSKVLRFQPFGKFETQRFVLNPNKTKDYNKYGGGVNYYVHAQNLKFTAQVQRIFPQNSPVKPSNQFTVQLQLFYF